jgi:glycine cleavage system H protein
MIDIRYTKDHEWARLEDDGSVTVGITDFAQQQLGDVVFVELPEDGAEVVRGEETAVVESVKAAADVKTPLSGTVLAVNQVLMEAPQKINIDPMGEGWFFRIEPNDPNEMEEMLDEDEYAEYVKTATAH